MLIRDLADSLLDDFAFDVGMWADSFARVCPSWRGRDVGTGVLGSRGFTLPFLLIPALRCTQVKDPS